LTPFWLNTTLSAAMPAKRPSSWRGRFEAGE
jgi:hypothetical protein